MATSPHFPCSYHSRWKRLNNFSAYWKELHIFHGPTVWRNLFQTKRRYKIITHLGKFSFTCCFDIIPSHITLAICSILVFEKDRKQQPVYFTSQTLQPVEERYQVIENMVLTLVFSKRWLRHYFRSFNIKVRTDYPIKQVLQKPELAGRMTTWSIEFSEFRISFKDRGPMKAQFLADFIVDLP